LQIALFFAICLPASLPSAFSAFNQPFVVGSPPHRCQLPPGRNELRVVDIDAGIDDAACYQYNETVYNVTGERRIIACQHGWEYDNDTYESTLVTEVS
jgi:hypothetical protein